ncbi:MAG: hypothetical protein NXI24_24640 [bacterium]|nr:hypothetical protein [bacterium]
MAWSEFLNRIFRGREDPYAYLSDSIRERDSFPTVRDWLNFVYDSIPDVHEIQPGTLARLKLRLRHHYGAEYIIIREDYDEHIEFWTRMRDRFPNCPELVVILADTCALAGRSRLAMELCFEGLEREPGLLSEYGGDLYDMAREEGQEFVFRHDFVSILQAYTDYDEDTEEYLMEIAAPYADRPKYRNVIRSALMRVYGEARDWFP